MWDAHVVPTELGLHCRLIYKISARSVVGASVLHCCEMCKLFSDLLGEIDMGKVLFVSPDLLDPLSKGAGAD